MSTARIIGVMILIGVGIMIWGYNKQPQQTTSINHGCSVANATTTITITPNAWVWVKVNGKAFEWDVPELNGVPQDNMKYKVVANDTKSKPVGMPKGSLTDIGVNIHTLYFIMEPNQGSSAAQVKVRLK